MFGDELATVNLTDIATVYVGTVAGIDAAKEFENPIHKGLVDLVVGADNRYGHTHNLLGLLH